MTVSDTTALDGAIAGLLRDLVELRRTAPRCGSCDNFLNVAAQASLDLRPVESAVAAQARGVFQGWLDEAEGKVQVCNNCETCVPAGPYERFTAALAAWRAGQGRRSH